LQLRVRARKPRGRPMARDPSGSGILGIEWVGDRGRKLLIPTNDRKENFWKAKGV